MSNINTNYILNFLLLAFIFIFNFYQLSFQHWSAILDNDIQFIFDTILVSSNIDQNLKDHPGFTSLFFFSLVIKFLNLFNPNIIYDLNEILSLDKPSSSIENIFIIIRSINTFFCYLLVVYFYKNLKCFEIKKNYRILIALILIFSEFFIDALFRINPDSVAFLFFLISNYYLITFFKKQKSYRIILSGSFLIFSLLSKILIIFNFFYAFLIFAFFCKNKTIHIEKYYRILSYYLLFVVFLFISFQIFLNFYDNRFKNLDLIFFSLYLFIFLIGINKILKLEHNDFYIIKKAAALLTIGAIITLFSLIFLSELGLVKFSLKNLLRLSNPFHYLTIYSSVNNLVGPDTNFFLLLFTKLLTSYSEFLNSSSLPEYILLFTCIITFLVNKKYFNNYLFFIYLSFLFIMFIVFIMKLRNIENILIGQNLGYYFYFKPTLLILTGFIFSKIKSFKIGSLFLGIFVIFALINSVFIFKGYYPYHSKPKKDFFSQFDRTLGFNKKDCKNLSDKKYVLANRYNNYLLRLTPYNDHSFYNKLCQELKLK